MQITQATLITRIYTDGHHIYILGTSHPPRMITAAIFIPQTTDPTARRNQITLALPVRTAVTTKGYMIFMNTYNVPDTFQYALILNLLNSHKQ